MKDDVFKNNLEIKKINLPYTDFPLNDNLLKFQEINNFWKKERIYEKKIKKNITKKPFILHSGPLYANGKIHMGHFLNSIIKDTIVRFFSRKFYTPFVFGWDAHGLPIELAVIKKNKTNWLLENNDFVSLNVFRNFASEQIKLQKSQIFKLGLFTNLDDYYSTMNRKYEAEQIRFFSSLIEKNLIFSDLKPVHWSWSNKTALSQNEIIYLKKKTKTIYFKFEIKNLEKTFLKSKCEEKIYFLIWTTQPWTIIANEFLAVNVKEKYVLVNFNNENIIVSENSLYRLFPKKNFIIKCDFLGFHLLDINYINPFVNDDSFLKKDNLNHYIISGENLVNCYEGSGIVHIAPAFGEEDFLLSKNKMKEIICPVNEDGKFNENINYPKFVNKYFYEVNELVIEFLSKKNQIFKEEKIIHDYPHDWRDKTPLMFRLTKQWFINTNKIKEFVIMNAKNVKWKPFWGLEKIISMIESQKNWCISRQRSWGVPLPIIYKLSKNGKEKEEILDYKIVNFIADVIEKEGIEFWFKDKIIEKIKERFLNLKEENIILEKDIMDVWFDSSISYFCLFNKGIMN